MNTNQIKKSEKELEKKRKLLTSKKELKQGQQLLNDNKK